MTLFPRRRQSPADLPRRYRWAADEIVRRRLEHEDDQAAIIGLKSTLRAARRHNADLRADLREVNADNNRLRDLVGDLETQLAVAMQAQMMREDA